ncbi:MAG: 30S ribosomal protein S9 [Euryarchaeota archaeon]|nr:30S ribosomal protein S9 [Euryarchaeota archaeon]
MVTGPKVVNTSGKKKRAVARATLQKGQGRITVNRRPLPLHLPDFARAKIEEPLQVAQRWAQARQPALLTELDIEVDVQGGGFMGQAEAVRTAIARGLAQWISDPQFEAALLETDRKILVSDHRRKWPKHFGGPGARSKKQKSYR